MTTSFWRDTAIVIVLSIDEEGGLAIAPVTASSRSTTILATLKPINRLSTASEEYGSNSSSGAWHQFAIHLVKSVETFLLLHTVSAGLIARRPKIFLHGLADFDVFRLNFIAKG